MISIGNLKVVEMLMIPFGYFFGFDKLQVDEFRLTRQIPQHNLLHGSLQAPV